MKQRTAQQQKMTTLTKGIMVAAGSSIAGMIVYFTIFFNSASVEEMKAEQHARSMMGYEVGDGEIISAFTWDDKNSVAAEKGPDAINISTEAEIIHGGKDESNGLSAGLDKKDINMEVPASKEFNSEGIDISLDFRRLEESCDFYSRGSYFNFGMRNGLLCISYKVSLGNGKNESINETTKYQVPQDNEFRNYRFMYNPQNGKGEIMVNGISVWSHSGPEQAPLFWKSWDNVIIGRGMNGNGSNMAIMDNLVVRATKTVSRMPIHLLNFEAIARDNHVMIRWFTAKEMETDSFIVERSINGSDYEEIGRVKAAGNSTTLQAYALADMHPVENQAAYYRLVPSNKALKSISVSVIGYKYRKDHIENMPAEKVEAAIKEQFNQSK